MRAFAMAEAAEMGGLDGVWLAERHFAAPLSPLDTGGAGIPSVVSAPLIISTAIVARYERLRVGVAVNVLPLAHPIRVAEEVATVDHISRGRVEFGVGRSGFARAYEGYGIPYAESRERFQESLDIILKAWTNDRFSYEGKYYQIDNVCVIPKPYQKPYPPLRIAATTKETFPQVGRAGLPVFVGLRGMDRPTLANSLEEYRTAWKEAGHGDEPSVFLRIPVYVGETDEQAYADAEESTMRAYQRLAQIFLSSASESGATADEGAYGAGPEALGHLLQRPAALPRGVRQPGYSGQPAARDNRRAGALGRGGRGKRGRRHIQGEGAGLGQAVRQGWSPRRCAEVSTPR